MNRVVLSIGSFALLQLVNDILSWHTWFRFPRATTACASRDRAWCRRWWRWSHRCPPRTPCAAGSSTVPRRSTVACARCKLAPWQFSMKLIETKWDELLVNSYTIRSLWGAVIAQWIRLRLPSCTPGSSPKYNIHAYVDLYSSNCLFVIRIAMWKERK